jgi:glutathione S-transferase
MTSMEYRSVAEARNLGGLRLALSMGAPGPWGEAAKGILHVKGIPYVPVAQYGAQPNDDLVAWTGHANAPVAVYENEEPRTGWMEILFLAERLSPKPRLIPEDAAERATMFGLAREICGEGGFGWSRRLMLIAGLRAREEGDVLRGVAEVLGGRYGWSEEEAAAAPRRVADILRLLSGQLARQKERGSDYFVGTTLTALDIYWATFALMLKPLAAEHCPLPAPMRDMYENRDPLVAAAADPALLDHRDHIYRNYLQLPMSF